MHKTRGKFDVAKNWTNDK